MIDLRDYMALTQGESMSSSKSGFTLIELVIVIAIFGILAAVFVPKFINLSSNAQKAATTAVAGALSAANASNYAIRSLNHTLGQPISNCKEVGNLLQGGIPSGYDITSVPVVNGSTINCTLTGPNETSANFNATGII